MQLQEIVEINQRGLVADAVNLGMILDVEKNRLLCQGFIFNYDEKKPTESTVGILDALRRSFHSRNEPNVHLVVQDYGKGKSHFALALANFFSKPFDSQEVQGILHQIENVTGKKASILEKILSYKQRSKRHLVICISGERGTDLKRMFLRGLIDALEVEGITDTVAQHICRKPIEYLECLNTIDLKKAEEYLKKSGNEYGDVKALIKLLQQDEYKVIPTVIEISKELVGYPINFEYEIELEKILEDTIKKLCSSETAIFAGIIILFDELFAYLQTWANNPSIAGGMALQNITNVCERNKSWISLMSFTQRRPSQGTQQFLINNSQEYNRLVSRLELAPSTYEPKSSLESVISNLIYHKKDTKAWNDFTYKWDASIRGESAKCFSGSIKKYKESGWTFEDFNKYVGSGSFPLHPITTYLLCHLDFTQGRTAVQFIKKDVNRFITEQEITLAGKVNYIYAFELVEAFDSNFANHSIYSDYQRALTTIKTSITLDQDRILKSLFLFYVAGDKLKKDDKTLHEEILSDISGLSTMRVKKALEELSEKLEVIHHVPHNNTYRFYSGFGLSDLRKLIQEETKDKPVLIDDVIKYCRDNKEKYVDSDMVLPHSFIAERRLLREPWQFDVKFLPLDQVEVFLAVTTAKELSSKGILLYVLAKNTADLQALKEKIVALLIKSKLHQHAIVAIPKEGVENLARMLLNIKTLRGKPKAEQEKYGQAHTQLLESWEKEIDNKLTDILRSCEYFSDGISKLPIKEREKLSSIASALMSATYLYTPSVNSVEKMRPGNSSGAKILGYVAKKLLDDTLNQIFPDSSYISVIDPVFVSKWGLLKKTSEKYCSKEPSDTIVKAAWDEISNLTSLNGIVEKSIKVKDVWDKLSAAPYGYDEFTFTILFAAWLSYHRAEVTLIGETSILKTPKKTESLTIDGPISQWANSNIWEKPKDFVAQWVCNEKNRLVRHEPARFPNIPPQINFDEATRYLDELKSYLKSGDTDKMKMQQAKEEILYFEIRIKKISEWEECIRKIVRNLPGTNKLKDVIKFFDFVHIPESDLNEKTKTTIVPTQLQITDQESYIKLVKKKVDEIVDEIKTMANSLTSEETYGSFLVEVQNDIELIKRHPYALPSYLVDDLEKAIKIAGEKKDSIKLEHEVKECHERIQVLFFTLDEKSTQERYIDILQKIDTLTMALPEVKKEISYKQAIASINKWQQDLVSQVDNWQERSTRVTSSRESINLRDEINREINRYTDGIYKEKVKDILSSLEIKRLEMEGKESEEQVALEEVREAEQVLQRITDLSLSKLEEAYKIYNRLTQSKKSSLAKYENHLSYIQTQANNKIRSKFAALFNRKLIQIKDYESMYDGLSKALSLIAGNNDFNDIKQEIEIAIEQLKKQYQELKSHFDDEQTMLKIRQLSLANCNTILLCQDNIATINKLQLELNDSEKFTHEIGKLLDQFSNKIASFQKSFSFLCEQIDKAENYKSLETLERDLLRMETIFQDSDSFVDYKKVQEKVYAIKSDLSAINELEQLCKKSDSLFQSEDLLRDCTRLITNLSEPNRYQAKLSTIESGLRQKCKSLQQILHGYLEQIEKVTLQNAQKLSEEIKRLAAKYTSSSLEQEFNAVDRDITLLVELSRIELDTKKATTLLQYDELLKNLLDWKSSVKDMSEVVVDRVAILYEDIEIKKEKYLNQLRDQAQKWLDQITKQSSFLEQDNKLSELVKMASEIVRIIEQEISKYESIISSEQKHLIYEIKQKCIDIHNRDHENQIILLFEKLPHEKQVSIYQKLKTYLSSSIVKK